MRRRGGKSEQATAAAMGGSPESDGPGGPIDHLRLQVSRQHLCRAMYKIVFLTKWPSLSSSSRSVHATGNGTPMSFPTHPPKPAAGGSFIVLRLLQVLPQPLIKSPTIVPPISLSYLLSCLLFHHCMTNLRVPVHVCKPFLITNTKPSYSKRGGGCNRSSPSCYGY